MPLCFSAVGIGARDDHAPLAVLRAGRPDLLAVDDPVVAVAHRAGAQTGEVRPGARFAEELAPDLFAAQHRAAGSAASAPSLPCTMIVGPSMPCPIPKMFGGVRKRLSSCFQMTLWIGVQPRPPYSFGQVMHAQPASAFLACHACARLIAAGSAARFEPGRALARLQSFRVGVQPGACLGPEFGFVGRVVEIHAYSSLVTARRVTCAASPAAAPSGPAIDPRRRARRRATSRADRRDGSRTPRCSRRRRAAGSFPGWPARRRRWRWRARRRRRGRARARRSRAPRPP